MMSYQKAISVACTLLILFCTAAVSVPAAVPASEGGLKPSHLTHLKWRNIGPAFISGRIADIEAVESDPDIVYVATSVGGLWKSTDRGSTLKPIFDQGGTASLGSVAIAPSNSNLLWLGSGETWNWRSVSWGDGVYVPRTAARLGSTRGW